MLCPYRWAGLCAVLVVSGCSRAPVAEFNTLADIAELPELHQKGIASGMFDLFGTANDPRQRIVDPEAEEPEEGPPTEFIDAVAPEHLEYGALVYNARCAGCHGVTGDGNGPAGEYLVPRPRDYRRGIFKFTSTAYGLKPARQDLVRTIRRGAKGTSMPAFPWMSDADLNAVIDYVIYLSQRGEVEREVALMATEYDETEPLEYYEFTDSLDSSRTSWADADGQVVLPVSAEPRYGEETVQAGRTLFLSKGCANCHGTDGKGQIEWLNPKFLAAQESLPEEQREKINVDVWGEPAPAADLTARMLHGGRRPIDIYRRIYTGINGTPMPAFEGMFAAEPDSIWHLVHYVRHIIEGGDPVAGIEALPPEEPAAEEVAEDAVVEAAEDTPSGDGDASQDPSGDTEAPSEDPVDAPEESPESDVPNEEPANEAEESAESDVPDEEPASEAEESAESDGPSDASESESEEPSDADVPDDAGESESEEGDTDPPADPPADE